MDNVSGRNPDFSDNKNTENKREKGIRGKGKGINSSCLICAVFALCLLIVSIIIRIYLLNWFSIIKPENVYSVIISLDTLSYVSFITGLISFLSATASVVLGMFGKGCCLGKKRCMAGMIIGLTAFIGSFVYISIFLGYLIVNSIWE